MLFTSLEFAIFFLFVLALNWMFTRGSSPYKGFLLLVNTIFYASLDYRFLPLLLVVGVSNWGGGPPDSPEPRSGRPQKPHGPGSVHQLRTFGLFQIL